MRATKKQLENIKKKYGVDTLWSWSKYHTYKEDPYSWMLKYIRHEKEKKSSIYAVSGGNCHQIIEDFYNKKISYEDMINEYEDKLMEMNLAELKYNRKDDKANKITADKYEGCIREFFKHHVPIKGKVITEQFVTIKVGKNIFQGYIDFLHKENGKYIITDWKTSSRYVGEKAKKECGQLVLYAESLIQRGVALEDIKIRWNFLKYCDIEYQLKGIDKITKLNKTKVTVGERNKWVEKIKNNLKMWLKEDGKEELEIEDMVQTAINNNNLDNIPLHIKSRYKISDCYGYIDLNKQIIEDLKEDIIDTINKIKEKERDYNIYMEQGEEDEAEHLFWTIIDDKNSFFFNNLCGFSTKQHKPYKEYLDDLKMWVLKDKENEKESVEDDMDWLNDL
ncbi:PD-(D/E)XK nuclease family protein [Clostridium botulinum]|uniref:PD-(D/E)XK nuclease family protein n=1 Tax=Clostridium botulinum TaxID=1491 RepID=UPI001C9B1DC8|nr:PD-(D/E)XK nuclease family protein [Clostridium botulinum]MBY6838670.1 PD-(D/E)XK nuclease family protein [Clostridium botulinum]